MTNKALHAPVRKVSLRLKMAKADPHGQFDSGWFKRTFDVLIASILLLLTLPAFCLITLFVLTAGWPVFYQHRRVGLAGRMFICLKFRTMRRNADAILATALRDDPILRTEWVANRKLRNDPRVTAVGRILRRTSLDELPQLFNVLKGDMSLVGPRPVVPEELQTYYGPTASQAYLSVRPGLTGLWQVSRRSDTSYHDRVELDCAYVANRSLASDIGLIVRTLGYLVRCNGR